MTRLADSDIYRVDGDRMILIVAAGDEIPDDVATWLDGPAPTPKTAKKSAPVETTSAPVEDDEPTDDKE